MEVTMDTDQSHLILKKSWDIALGPIKQVSLIQSSEIGKITQNHETNEPSLSSIFPCRYQWTYW